MMRHPRAARRGSRPSLVFLLAVAVASVVLQLTGCDDAGKSGNGGGGAGGSPDTCEPGEVPRVGGGCCQAGELPLEDGRCLPAGTQENGCPAGEVAVADGPVKGGSCRPAGVSPEKCGEGFEADGNRACKPILPEEPCPPGKIALLGELECHELGPCGAGEWGDIPVESNTQFVNASYAYENGTSDGTKDRPWIAVQDAIDAAEADAIVAVAAGSYSEDLVISGQPVRLWGRCPAMVELVGTGGKTATVTIKKHATGSEVRGIAIRGPVMGVLASGSEDLLLAQVWIHDTENNGLYVENEYGPTSLMLSRSLVEHTRVVGALVIGGSLTVEDSVVRDTQPRTGDLKFGRGIDVEGGGAADVRHTVIAGSYDGGVLVAGAELTIEDSLVHRTQSRASDQQFGGGVYVQNDPMSGARAHLLLRASVIDQSYHTGVFVVGADATIETTTIRETAPVLASQHGGRGLSVQDDIVTGERAKVEVRESVLEASHANGVFVGGSDALLEATIVRATQQDASQSGGHGVDVQDHIETGALASLTLRGSVLSDNTEIGLGVLGATATIDGTVVQGTRATGADETLGRGIDIETHAETGRSSTLSLSASVVQGNRDAGVFVSDSDATLTGVVIRETQVEAASQTSGRGVVVQQEVTTGDEWRVQVVSCVIERNHEAGMFFAGGRATVDTTLVRDSMPVASYAGSGRGINVQDHPTTANPAEVVLSKCVVDQNTESGIFVAGAAAKINGTVVRRTQPASFDESAGRGVVVQRDPKTGARGSAVIHDCLITESHDVAIYISDSDVRVEGTTIRDTAVQVSDDLFGDGIAVVSHGDVTTAEIQDCEIDNNARAGLAVFSADVKVSRVTLGCNLIDLDAEDTSATPASLEDLGENVCGCGAATVACQVKRLGLAPPAAADPLNL